MIQAAQYYLAIYGVLVAVGGIMGFVKAKSKASLISGVVSGLLILGAFGYSMTKLAEGLIIGLIISVLLVIMMGVRLAKTKKFMPAGLVLVLSIISIPLSGIALSSAYQQGETALHSDNPS